MRSPAGSRIRWWSARRPTRAARLRRGRRDRDRAAGPPERVSFEVNPSSRQILRDLTKMGSTFALIAAAAASTGHITDPRDRPDLRGIDYPTSHCRPSPVVTPPSPNHGCLSTRNGVTLLKGRNISLRSRLRAAARPHRGAGRAQLSATTCPPTRSCPPVRGCWRPRTAADTSRSAAPLRPRASPGSRAASGWGGPRHVIRPPPLAEPDELRGCSHWTSMTGISPWLIRWQSRDLWRAITTGAESPCATPPVVRPSPPGTDCPTGR